MRLATYIFVVRAKYLQLLTAFYLFNNVTEKVEQEFQLFQEDVEELQRIHKKVFKVEFAPQDLSAVASGAVKMPGMPPAITGARDDVHTEVWGWKDEALNGKIGQFASCFSSIIGQSYLDKTVFTLRASPEVSLINSL